MIMNQTPYPISFEREMSQALVCRYGEEMRQYVFKPDIDVSGLSCLLQIAKTDGTFTENGVEVHTDPDTGECTLVITIPQQATVVKGLNRYSICVYGPIEGEDHLLYSAEGPLWVDDDLITDEMIASVAEVNGLVFPQDFLTVENLVDIVNYVAAEILNDNTISTDTTWSSQKISDEIEGHSPDIDVSKEASGNPIEFSDGADAPLVKCVTQITGYQQGNGTPSPDNIRPIVAYSTGTIVVEDGDGNTTTHTTTYPSAIYRGSEDVVNGEVTAQMNKISFDGTDSTGWVKFANYGSVTRFDYDGVASNIDFREAIIANYLERVQIGTERVGINVHSTVNKIQVQLLTSDLATDDVSGLMGYFTSHPLEVAYTLATPTTSSVTPTNLPIKSLSGYSHIESTTGDMEVEYLTQTYEPIAELIDRSSLHVYSTEEKVVGKWIDNKNVYEKTFILNTEITLTVNQWNSITGVTLSSVDTPVNAEIRNSRGITFANIDFLDSPVSIWGQNGNEKVKSITFRYTKS